jgi:hypothetical protein
MSFEFPEYIWARVIEDNSDRVILGKINDVNNQKIQKAIVGIFKHGFVVGDPEVKLQLHTSTNYSKVYAETDWLNIKEWSYNSLNVEQEYFIGLASFDFSKENLAAGQDYYLTAKTQNYTRNLDVSYLSLYFGYPNPEYPTGITTEIWYNQFPIKFSYFGIR